MGPKFGHHKLSLKTDVIFLILQDALIKWSFSTVTFWNFGHHWIKCFRIIISHYKIISKKIKQTVNIYYLCSTSGGWLERNQTENQSKIFKSHLRIAKKTFDNLFNLHARILVLNFWTSTETFVVPNYKSQSTQF